MLILRGPRKKLQLTHDAEGWKEFLADPEKHWKDGRSAKMLAEAWEAAAPRLPDELTRAFEGTPFASFVPLLAIPEYQVDLPGGRAPSQNDLFVLGRIGSELAVLMIEGKVDESFGPLLSEWLRDASPGKLRRLAFLQETLGLETLSAEVVRYQLLHRTASAVLEATRLKARYAGMIVHSFSGRDAGLEDYRTFATGLAGAGEKGAVERAASPVEPELWLGWVSGDATQAVESTSGNARGPLESLPDVSSAPRGRASLPRVIAHADWGTDPSKRWLCVAELNDDGGYRIQSPEPVEEAGTLLSRLRQRAGGDGVVAGFDFPIGVPSAWAERAGIEDFVSLLPKLGEGEWADFYTAASTPGDIRLTRPFYPMRPGGTKQRHLVEALGVDDMSDLLRLCDRATETRGAACPIFWTLGGKQVGKAALLGWREVLVPALADPDLDISLWPFHGDLVDLLPAADVVVVETYPAESCVHLGITPPGRGWSKRRQEDRASHQDAILEWVQGRPVRLDETLSAEVADGFGPSKHAEDPFDALLGLLSMVEVVLGYRSAGAPDREDVRSVEGWILGQEAEEGPETSIAR